ncbi:hypothetical protein [Streptomyces sp. IB201691-2A2]|uniref:hypothetical protein n=1 Tax=Streptomyces sp. IB201691-2A2 TaxID=2561920 RepID=UPI00117C9EFD|nr:hypothetical protein [Streptomyces sp. IB201691-2A2]TRO64776.1 hypothetical protein E4K73_15005 [Streptomyces sp. IB201691-2A2]
MRIDSVLLAEGIATDARGAFTAVGVNQKIISSAALPFAVKQNLVLIFTDESDESEFTSPEGKDFSVSVRLLDPDGQASFAVSQPLPKVKKSWVDLPSLMNLVVEVSVSGNRYGKYSLVAALQEKGVDQEKKVITLFVTPALDLTSASPERPGKAFG